MALVIKAAVTGLFVLFGSTFVSPKSVKLSQAGKNPMDAKSIKRKNVELLFRFIFLFIRIVI
jgi:hypothetical protein